MGQTSFPPHGFEPDLLHTLHFTRRLPGSSLVCDKGETKVRFGRSLFKTVPMPIILSISPRLG